MPSVTPKFEKAASSTPTASERVDHDIAEEVCKSALALVNTIWTGTGAAKYDAIDKAVVEMGDYLLEDDPERIDALRMVSDIVELHQAGVTAALVHWCEDTMGWDADPDRLALRFFPTEERTGFTGKGRQWKQAERQGLLHWLCNLIVIDTKDGNRRRAIEWKTDDGTTLEPAFATELYLNWPQSEAVPSKVKDADIRPVTRRIDPEQLDQLSDDIKTLMPSESFGGKQRQESRPAYNDPEVEVQLTQMLRIDLDDSTVEKQDEFQKLINGVLTRPPVLPDYATFKFTASDAVRRGKLTQQRADEFDYAFKSAAAAAYLRFSRSKAKKLLTRQKQAYSMYVDVLSELIV